MVPVGDQRLAGGEVVSDCRLFAGIGHCPEPVPESVGGPRFDQWRSVGGLGHDPSSRASTTRAVRTVVEKENWLKVGLRCLHQLQSVGHRAG